MKGQVQEGKIKWSKPDEESKDDDFNIYFITE